MAHFAEINENNEVLRVIVIHNNELLDEYGVEQESKGRIFCEKLFGGNWIQTSYTAGFRKNYAGPGYIYDPARDAFIPPQSFPSWILNEETCRWEPPLPYPQDKKLYMWDEDTLKWTHVG